MTSDTRKTNSTRPSVCPAIHTITTMAAAVPIHAHGGTVAWRLLMPGMVSRPPGA